MVNWIDWEILGRALGAGLNLALNFLTSFLYAFDWMNLGRKLAEFVNGLVDEIDWYEFGRLLWAGFKITLETLAGFIVGLDMPLMARAASNIILGFFDEMKNTINRIPWYKIGAQIATFLNNIDWYSTLTSVIRAIQAALRALQQTVAGFVDTLKWSDIAEKIYTAINDSFGNLNWRHIGQTLGDAFVHVFDFARQIIAGIHWQEIGKAISEFILGFDFVSALSSLAQLIAEGLNAAVRLVNGLLSRSAVTELKHIAEGIANALRDTIDSFDWSALGAAIGKGIKTALTFVSGLLDPSLFYAIGKAIGDFIVGLDWVGIIGGLAEVLAKAIGAAVAAVKGLLDSVQPNLKAIADGIAQKINKFFDDVDWAELGRTISRGIEAALDFLLELIQKLDWDKIGQSIADLLANVDWETLLETWGKVMGEALSAKFKLIDISGIVDVGKNLVKGLKLGWTEEFEYGGGFLGWLKRNAFDKLVAKVKEWLGIHSPSTVFAEIGQNIVAGLLQGITEKWNGIVEFFKGKVDGIKQIFSDAWTGIKEAASTAWDGIKTFLSDTWDKIKETAGTAFNAIKEKVSAAWDGVKEKTSAIWDGIKTALGTIWDNLKTTASTIFENIKTAISTAWENVKSKTTETWNNIKTALTTIWNNLKTTVATVFNEIKNKVVEVWNNIKDEAVSKWNEITSTISNKINEIKTKVSEGFAKVKETITGKIQEAIDWLKNKDWASIGRGMIDGIMNGLSGIFDKLKGWASNVWNSITGAFSSSNARASVSNSAGRAASYRMATAATEMETYTLPKLANGAVIPPNQQFMAILGDQRRGTNIEAPLATIEKALQNVMDRNSGNGGGPLEINLVVSGKVLARAVVPEINDMTRSAGKPVLLV